MMQQLKENISCYLLHGEDEWSKNNVLQQIKENTIDSAQELMNYQVLEGKDIRFSTIEDFGETMPFFAEKKLLILKESGFFKPGKKEESEKLHQWLQKVPSYMVVVFVEGEVDKRSKLYKLVNTKQQVIDIGYPGDDRALAILAQAAQQRHLQISKSMLDYFISRMAKNIGTMMVELEKLASYIGDRPVDQKAIDAVCSFSLEDRIFEMIKALVAKNMVGALKIYHQLIDRKESPIGMLVLLARQYRFILQTKYLLRTTTDQRAIASSLGVAPFVARELMGQAKVFSFGQLEHIVAKCLETDTAIKTGQLEPVYALEMLMMECILSQ